MQSPPIPGAYLTIAGSKDFSAAIPTGSSAFPRAQTKEAFIVQDADHIYNVQGNDQTMANSVIKKRAEWFATTLAP